MAGPIRTEFEREAQLPEIAGMYLRGMSQNKIGEQLGLTQQQISYDLKEVQRRWQQSVLVDINLAKNRELARIDEIEKEAWDAWQRSKTALTKTTTSVGGKDGSRATTTKEQRVGDAAYLSHIEWCVAERCRILGLYEAAKISFDWRKAVEEKGLNAGEVFERMVESYMRAVDPDAADQLGKDENPNA